MSNGTVINIDVNFAKRWLQVILNEIVQKIGQNPMMMDIEVISTLAEKMEILEENAE